ncbi:MAG: thioredoxin domain-containing protein [Flavobacteriales bacterium]|nr:thioredoxin domain-containing protein [Flavobacteriales bacterium]
MSNRLAKEKSPYLQQHAENPVDWFPWGEEAFEKAKSEGKLMLISIGYSSCHWCHVMEHETFSNNDAASVMNRYFVCVKVDREERPDLDQVYMNAVQLMSGQGGWPLNCFVLPDGRPVYGGTYFPTAQWMKILYHLHAIWKDEPEKVLDYAERLTQGVQLSDLVEKPEKEIEFENQHLLHLVEKWKRSFDMQEGGPNRAPKFPLPNNYLFLLHYAIEKKDDLVLKHVLLTLDKIALGGIYDQLGGGITRYSVDLIWKVPHFEKMLYDNAQIISLYAEAYRYKKDHLYLEMVERSLQFCEREFGSAEHGFYSALDADSEGEEGSFYVWTKTELQSVLKEDYDWFAAYYQVNYLGEWEDGKYILLRREKDEAFAHQHKMSVDELQEKKSHAHLLLMEARNKRERPFLDNKKICSWNALMIRSYADAFRCTGKQVYRERALKLGHFILREFLRGDGGLYHILHGEQVYVNGFLEDHAFVLDAFIQLFEISSDEFWLQQGIRRADYVIEKFSDPDSPLFYFTSVDVEQLIARKTEITDNVIPASNSVMAQALYSLGEYSGHSKYSQHAEQMLQMVYPHMADYGSSYSNWADLLLRFLSEKKEIILSGTDAEHHQQVLWSHYHPYLRVLCAAHESELPMLKNRFKTGAVSFYVCRNNSCNLPVTELQQALELLQ